VLDLIGSVSGGTSLRIDTAYVSDLKLDGAATTASAISITNANQTLEIGGNLTIGASESITNGTIRLSGGTLNDSLGVTLGSGGRLTGVGTVNSVLSGTGSVQASYGLLDLQGSVASGVSLAIYRGESSVLKIDGTATAAVAIGIYDGFQELEIGSAGNLMIGAAESITYGTIRLDGGSLTDSAGITIGSGTLIGKGMVTGPVGGGGVIEASGSLDLTGSVQSSATGLQIANGSNTLDLDGSVAAGATITFDGTAGTLKLTDFTGQTLTGFGGTVAGMNVGASTVPTTGIDLTGVTRANVTSAQVSGASIVVKEGAATVATINLDSAPPANTYVDWIADGGAGTEIFLSTAACYRRGTLIETPDGEVPIEELAIGDEVVTFAGEPRRVRWIGRRAYDGRFIAGNRAVLPIRIMSGALADGVPARDLYLSPEHSLYIDGVLVQAAHLVNGATIVQVDAVEEVEYFHIELDTHDVIFADGAPAETYVDCDNRFMFQNAGEFAGLYSDNKRPVWDFCAPRLERGSPELTATRAALLERAEGLGYTLDSDPDLHLIADGEIVPAQRVLGAVHRFDIPAGSTAVWLASRSVVPAETDAASRDIRRLGVAVERLVLCDGDLSIEAWHGHPGLYEGFHDDEATHRWTNGLGRLPEALLRLFDGAFALELHLASTALGYRVPAAERAAA
jgi:Hint domain-containing protein